MYACVRITLRPPYLAIKSKPASRALSRASQRASEHLSALRAYSSLTLTLSLTTIANRAPSRGRRHVSFNERILSPHYVRIPDPLHIRDQEASPWDPWVWVWPRMEGRLYGIKGAEPSLFPFLRATHMFPPIHIL